MSIDLVTYLGHLGETHFVQTSAGALSLTNTQCTGYHAKKDEN